MILKVKDENGHFKEVVLKGLKGERGERGERGEDGTVLQQKEIDDIKSSLDNMKKQRLSPEMFGAIADGTTDDTKAFNYCIESLEEHGTMVLKGEYAISNVELKSNIVIEGNNSKIVKKDSLNKGIFYFDGKSNITIKDLIFDDNGVNNGYLIECNNASKSYSNNIVISNIKYKAKAVNGKGLYLGNVINANISNCYLENTVGESDFYTYGICIWSTEKIGEDVYNTNSKNITIRNNTVKGFTKGINSYGTGVGLGGNRQRMIIDGNTIECCLDSGIYAYHSPRSKVINNTVLNCKLGIWSDSGSDNDYIDIDKNITLKTRGEGNVVAHNNIINCEQGLMTEEYDSGIIQGNTFLKCSYYGIGIGGGTKNTLIDSNNIRECDLGILIDQNLNPNTYYIENNIISNNVITKCGRHGLYIKKHRNLLNITNNHITNCGENSDETNKYSAIFFEEGANSKIFRIANNYIGNTNDTTSSETTGKMSYGIHNSSKNAQELFIQNNTFYNLTSEHIYARYVTNLVIINNIFGGAAPTFNIGQSTSTLNGNIGGLTN